MRSPAAWVVLGGLALVGCSGPSSGTPAAPTGDAPAASSTAGSGAWTTTVLAELGAPLSGVALGDVLPEHPGNEIVAVATDHRMHVCWFDGTAWRHEVVATAPGELIGVATGRLDPSHAGDDIVAVGNREGDENASAPGALLRVTRVDGAWSVSTVLTTPGLLHGVAVGGAVVWATGFDRRLHRLVGGRAEAAAAVALPGPGKSVAVTHDGAVVACPDGSVVRVIAGADGTLDADVMHHRPAGRARIAAAGDDVLVGDDDGTLTLVGRDGAEEVFRAADKLRGAVLADLDPEVPGLEAATAGFDGAMRVFVRGPGGWTGTVVAQEPAKFHHLTAGPLPGFTGTVLVGASYSGRLVAAVKQRP